ncbi:hypothetical protein ACFQQB_35985 [Nonomuraea rubra]|uniref:hypothetical protein n=1 Tax=Nonomuraea rubra TaxID=46180 RepID=UPI00360C44CB
MASCPSGNRNTASGISATDGIGRRNSTSGRAERSMNGTVPNSSPAGTATAIAIASPSRHGPSVASTSVLNCTSSGSVAAVASTCDTYGR